jgi:hypothetical protein
MRRDKVEQWSPESGRKQEWRIIVIGHRISVQEDEKFQEMDDDSGCPCYCSTVQLKILNMVNFIYSLSQ